MKGTYTILVTCESSMRVKFGRLGYAEVGKGFYLYTGSALGRGAVSLEGRLKRHSRVSKRVRWHVDYLTCHPSAKVKAAVCLRSPRRLECLISRAVSGKMNASPLIPHIGASDCKCRGHLVRADSSLNAAMIVSRLKRIYLKFGQPFLLSVYPETKSPDLLPTSSRTRLERS